MGREKTKKISLLIASACYAFVSSFVWALLLTAIAEFGFGMVGEIRTPIFIGLNILIYPPMFLIWRKHFKC